MAPSADLPQSAVTTPAAVPPCALAAAAAAPSAAAVLPPLLTRHQPAALLLPVVHLLPLHLHRPLQAAQLLPPLSAALQRLC